LILEIWYDIIMNLNDILKTINQWKIEAACFRNDGWVQAHYVSQLEKILEEVLSALKVAQEPKNIKVLDTEETIIKDPILKNLYIDDVES
tara:strand:- start:960 stop:1229 length:270 start_codon:yes stop_codon:yes gene_type:complete